MRRFQCFLAGVILLAGVSVGGAVKAQPNGGFLFGGVEGGEENLFAYLGGGLHLTGGPDEDGWIVRGLVGGGEFDYEVAPGVVGEGSATTFDLMLGRQFVDGSTRVSVYAGGNYQDLDLANPADPAHGDEWGAKGQVEVYSEPSPNMMLLGIASYSTARDSYLFLGKAGWRMGDSSLFLGPEIAAHGNERYDRQRVGVHLTGFRVGPLGFSASVGAQSSETDDSGFYGSIGFTSRF